MEDLKWHQFLTRRVEPIIGDGLFYGDREPLVKDDDFTISVWPYNGVSTDGKVPWKTPVTGKRVHLEFVIMGPDAGVDSSDSGSARDEGGDASATSESLRRDRYKT